MRKLMKEFVEQQKVYAKVMLPLYAFYYAFFIVLYIGVSKMYK